jgi:Phosphatidylglycerophosphatase A and related proteins
MYLHKKPPNYILVLLFILIIDIGDEMETKTCLKDAFLTLKDNTLIIEREEGLLSLGTSDLGGGLGMIKTIIVHSLKSLEDPYPPGLPEGENGLGEILEEDKVLEPAAVTLGNFDIENGVNITYDKVTALVMSDDSVGLPAGVTVLVDEDLDEPALLELFKAAVEGKNAALWDLGLINGLSLDLFDSGNYDSVLVACTGFGTSKTDEEADILRSAVGTCVREATENLLQNMGYPRDVLGYMESVGVTIEYLVDAGMELCVGVDETPELKDKLRKQLLKSLEDLNVVSLIMAGIRLEEDYARHRVRGVDVDDDPAYLYSDEVLGMAVANQIAGTKAIFNFKRYDEEKPGIIRVLGPVLDDVFAGLVAGCMSKIFEE